MQIESIDNMNTIEGPNLLWLMLTNMAAAQRAPEPPPTRRRLLAILPEYLPDGTLNRLDVLTVPMNDPGPLTGDALALAELADRIVQGNRDRRAAALAALNRSPLPIAESIAPGSERDKNSQP